MAVKWLGIERDLLLHKIPWLGRWKMVIKSCPIAWLYIQNLAGLGSGFNGEGIGAIFHLEGSADQLL